MRKAKSDAASTASQAVVELTDVKKIYSMGDAEVQALRGVSFKVEQGEFISIMGPSGSGKSTCMNMIGCLDRPTSGVVKIDGRETHLMNETELAVLRNKTIGFVFQQYHLIPSMTVIENVMLPLKYKRFPREDRYELARAALKKVGLENRENHRPNELSGGQKQRVAIARAIIAEPKIILADEPTGALDTKTGIQVMDLFREINKTGTTIIIVTHDPGIGKSTERCIKILDGLLC
ncbi:ABC transporter ATP-binding protein [Treponema sp.]|uniref:ABC transporter ATP-binding protein n=1 Tax=Treponema sp. TaxID=166 RepID=UPI00298DE120|nr:ABC transporter ATP-binding protein [Treponema sp.]